MNRAGPDVTAQSTLAAWFLREWYEDWDRPEADRAATEVLDLLRTLPVEQRMEAMGMTKMDCAQHFSCGMSKSYDGPGCGYIIQPITEETS